MDELLQRRNKSRASASADWHLDRNTFTKFAKGGRVTLDWIERFAERSGEDVAYWREICGYPVHTGPDLEPAEADYAQVFRREYQAMKERLAADGIATTDKGAHFGGSEGLTAEDAAAEIAELERLLRKYAGKG